MIDPIKLVLVHDLEQIAVQFPGGFQIGAERLLDHKAPPAVLLIFQKAQAAQLFADWPKGAWGNREIKQVVLDAVGGADLVEMGLEASKRSGLGRIGVNAQDTVEQLLGNRLVDWTRCKLLKPLHKVFMQGLAWHFRPRDADHAEFLGEKTRFGKIVEGRYHQPMRQVTRDAEDHEAARIRNGRLGGGIGTHRASFDYLIGGSVWPPKP